MATTRPRHTITETDEIAAALDAAAERWPGAPRAELLRRLVVEGRRSVEADRTARREQRLQAIRRSSGMLRGVYRPDELARLREDWPE
ncbi:hypothetical protein ACVU7I_04430 [Patulibacter sp. S7RM1-6]